MNRTCARISVLALFTLAWGCTKAEEEPCEQSWFNDDDEDGHGDPLVEVVACEAPAYFVALGDDCDDLDGSKYPGAPELCNGVDDDCDDEADEGLEFSTWYADLDHDGFGAEASTVEDCEAPANYVDAAGDCDDSNPDAWPGAPEPCAPVDLNCDDSVDRARIDGVGYGTLLGAIAAAGDGDEVEVCVGEFTDALSIEGVRITLRGATGDPADVILDGGGVQRILTYTGDGLRVAGLSFVDGYAIDGGGSAIFATTNSLEVVDCAFDGNRSDLGDGGAIAFVSTGADPALVIDGTGFTDNATGISELDASTFSGGAVHASGAGPLAMAISGSSFEGNEASADGGAVYVLPECSASGSSSVTVEGTDFHSNVAEVDGGGLYLAVHGATIDSSTFEDDHSGNAGGGVYFGREDRCAATTDSLTVTDTEMVANYADIGGAILAWSDGTDALLDVTIDTVEFSRNSAFTFGAGVAVSAEGEGGALDLTLADTTMTENVAVYGGGGFLVNAGGDLVTQLDVSITGGVFENNNGGFAGGVAMVFPTNAALDLQCTTSDWSEDGEDNLPYDLSIGWGLDLDYDFGDAASFTCSETGCP